MAFSFTLPQSVNYCASDLMYRYARSHRGVTFSRDRYFTSLLECGGHRYVFDHWHREKHPDGTETVTVYMKEVLP